MASFISRLLGRFRKQQTEVRRSRRERTRKLRLEHMEHRRLMASDIANIGGNVFTDLTDNGSTVDDTDIVGVAVRLFLDGGNSTFESSSGVAGGDDTLVATQNSNGTGDYLFEDLGPGRYFVQQAAAAGRVQRASETVKTVVISNADSEGVGVLTIDNFTDNTTAIIANSGTPSANSFTPTTLSNTLGGERDLVVNHTAGGNDIDARVSTGIFSVNPGAGTSGNAILTFDGVDSDATTLDHTNLSQNLTAGGAEAFQFLVGSEAGNTMTITVHSGSGNFSTRTAVALPVTVSAAPTEILTVRYSDFTLGGGTGANFSNVTAIQIQITTAASSDAQIDLNQTISPFLSTENFANLNPMSIGDRVWRDSDNDGTLDVGENGIQNVTVQLFADTNSNNTFDSGTDLQVGANTTTNATGNYLFSDLLPGSYFVVIPTSNFSGAGALVGHTSSTAVQAPNTDTNNQNKGSFVVGVGAVTTAALTLSAGGEPTTDGDANTNSNLSLDFGFAPDMDLEVVKTVNAATVTAGNQVTYTLTVTNNGPGVADNVVVVDDLPNLMTIVSVTANPDGTVTQTGNPTGEIEVAYATLASGATRTITVVAGVAATQAAATNVVNTATVSGDGIDSEPDNDSDTANVNVVRQAVLQITKTDTPDPVLVGQALNYQIIVTNTGASTATNLEVRDTLPAGLTFNSVNATTGTPTHLAGLISLDLATLAVGSSVTINVGTTVQSNFAGSTVANTATAVAVEATQVTAQSNTAVNPQLDLQITKADSADPVTRGAQLTYTLNVRNDGPSAATNVQVVDTLPADVTFVSASGPVGSTVTPPAAPSRDVTISIGNMASGATGVITIIVTVNQNAGASFTNSAIIRSTESLAGFDTNTVNNTDTENTATQRVIDLAITKADSATVGNPIRPGGTVTYTMTATNNGPSDATLVRVTDNIPDGLQITSATIGASAITIPTSASDTNSANPDDLVFNIGNLASTASATLTVIANVLPGFRSDLLNSAVISTTDTTVTETITNNNSASITTPLSPLVDVAVTKSSPSGSTVIAGNALIYHIDVTNTGPSTATNVSLSDTLPAGLTFGSVSSQQGTVSHANGLITGNLGTLAPGATVRVTVNTTVAAATRNNLSNTATVTSTETDSNSVNNTSTLPTTINSQIDLRVAKAKTNPNDPAIAGGSLTYSIIVTNDGPSSATNVMMTDVLPNGLTFTQATSTVGNVNNAGQTVTANIGTLAPGASATVTINASVAASASGTLSNTAAVTGTETESNTNNNSSTLNTPIAVTGSITGRTYIDADRNGVFGSGELGVAGVTMTLTGTDILGRPVSLTATTNTNGEYSFADVQPGTYTVVQTQPRGLQSLQNNVGTPAGGTAGNNQISTIALTSGVNAVAYNFGEVPNPLSKRRFLASSDEFA